jgi:hypothetical protein
MTGITLFGGAVCVCLGAVVVSPILRAFGRGNLDVYVGAIAEVAMLGLMMGGIWMVIAMIMTMFGINVPIGFDAVDQLFTLDLPKRWW